MKTVYNKVFINHLVLPDVQYRRCVFYNFIGFLPGSSMSAISECWIVVSGGACEYPVPAGVN